jgi:type I restriction enzyme R subunit
VLFNNLATFSTTTLQCAPDEDDNAKLALEIDQAIRARAPAGDGWQLNNVRACAGAGPE